MNNKHYLIFPERRTRTGLNPSSAQELTWIDVTDQVNKISSRIKSGQTFTRTHPKILIIDALDLVSFVGNRSGYLKYEDLWIKYRPKYFKGIGDSSRQRTLNGSIVKNEIGASVIEGYCHVYNIAPVVLLVDPSGQTRAATEKYEEEKVMNRCAMKNFI